MPPAFVTILSPGWFRNEPARLPTTSPKSVTQPADGVARFLMREDRHRQLGQIFEGQIIEPAGFAQPRGRIEVVPPKTGSIPDANRFHG